MILLNSDAIDKNHFPDGSQMLLNVEIPHEHSGINSAEIVWKYENDEECMTLFYLVNHIRDHSDMKITLTMSYLPNARMDRTKNANEIFTLKYFCKFINSLNFDKVIVLDPHSNVSVALLDRVEVKNGEGYIRESIYEATEKIRNYIKNDTLVYMNVNDCFYIYFPDAGSLKRYSSLDCFKGCNLLYGEKDRDWETGEIRGLKIFHQNGERIDNIYDLPLNGKTVLMVDDIISYGGTMYHSAIKLKSMGASEIYAYATHAENSVLDEEKGTFIKALNDGTVERLYTTDSLFSKKHPKITVLK